MYSISGVSNYLIHPFSSQVVENLTEIRKYIEFVDLFVYEEEESGGS